MRQDVYNVAYQEAKSELLDITCKFEQLRQRKTRLEGVVAALGPMLGAPATAPVNVVAPLEVVPQQAPQPEPAPVEAPAYTFNQIASSGEEADDATNDPFERRIRNALKFGNTRREGLQHAV
ncbi:MAG TPA: hypothetical protein VG893_03030 [Terracidiphilus sp.]|nr:hypothetical protein [Terracidiphilus sp.]